MSELNEIYGPTLALPSEVSGILISGAPAPNEAVNGLYELGEPINGKPAFYFGTHVIASFYSDLYALYHTDWLIPDADNEIWNLGPYGTGPVSDGVQSDPYPTVVGLGEQRATLPAAMVQAASQEHNLDAFPSAALLAGSATNDLSALPVGFEPWSYPPNQLGGVEQFPMLFWVHPRPAISSFPIRIAGTAGTITNELTGMVTAFDNNIVTTVSVVPNQWQRFFISADSPDSITSVRFQAVSQPAGLLIPVLDGLKTDELFITPNFRLLDFRVRSGAPFNRVEIARLNVDGITIDKIIVALALGGRLNGNLIYNITPEANDSFRSPEAAAAMATLLANGWTITR